MENLEDRWSEIEEMLLQRFGKVPDMEAILFLIGMNELGMPPKRLKWTKEQKQDLMHIAVCHLLSQKGYYRFLGCDEDGWPHFEEVKPVETTGFEAQEKLLKECIIRYFHG